MTNILTAAEASRVLRDIPEDDDLMLELLPSVDRHIETATGRAWQNDDPIDEAAKSAARMLLTMWYENPAMVGKVDVLTYGLNAALTQLEALALKWQDYEFEGASTSAYIILAGAKKGDQVVSLVGLWGVSGDQSTNFESVITEDDHIVQTSASDLSDNGYLVTLISAKDALE
jgi:hypothetical protein